MIYRNFLFVLFLWKRKNKLWYKPEIKIKTECKINEYILCIYIPDIYKIEEDTFLMIENTIELESVEKYFKSVFVIIKTENEQSLKKYFRMKK